MGRTPRARTLFWKEPEPQRESLREEGPLLRANSSPGTQETRSWGRNLFSTVDHVRGFKRARLGAARRLHYLGRLVALNRVQAHSKQGRGAAAPLPVLAIDPGNLSATYVMPASLQESESHAEEASGWPGGSVEISRPRGPHLALHRELGKPIPMVFGGRFT